MSTLAETITRRAAFAEANGTTGKSKTAKAIGNILVAAVLLAVFNFWPDVIAILAKLLN